VLTFYRGGFVVWRAAQWYPDLVSHVFSVCTPYTAPHEKYYSTEDLVKGQLPQFAYQLHLASGEVEKSVKDEQSIRQFLKGLYGARGSNGELAFDPEKGVLAENLPFIGESRILHGKVRNTDQFFVLRRMSIHRCGHAVEECGCSTSIFPHLWKTRGKREKPEMNHGDGWSAPLLPLHDKTSTGGKVEMDAWGCMLGVEISLYDLPHGMTDIICFRRMSTVLTLTTGPRLLRQRIPETRDTPHA
jgi:hypothetical protein